MEYFWTVVVIWMICCFVFTFIWCAISLLFKRKRSLKPVTFGPFNFAKEHKQKLRKMKGVDYYAGRKRRTNQKARTSQRCN